METGKQIENIAIERIKPGRPQQNGRHERMHLTLKKEATKPAAANVLQQQARFDAFVEQFNRERPHQALAMKMPAEVYGRSARIYRGLEDLTYPFHDHTILVTHCGRICFKSQKVNLSQVFAGQNVGVTQVGESHLARQLHALRFGIFRRRDLPARTDRESVRPESVTYVLGMNCHPCDRNRPKRFGVPNGIRTRVLALKGPRPRPLDDGDARMRRNTKSYHAARPGRAQRAGRRF